MIDWLKRLLRRDPTHEHGRNAAYEAVPAAPGMTQALKDEFRAGKRLYAAGRVDEAAERFEAVLERKHDWADAHHWLGICRLSQGRAVDAHDAFTLAICFDAGSVRARYGMALAEQALGRSDDALCTLDGILAAHADHADAYNMRGGLRLERNDVAGALSDFERAIAADPAHVKAHSNLGHVLFCDCGEYERGAAHIARALELAPDHRPARFNLALVLSHRGDDRAALDLCDRLLAEEPDLLEARFHRALVCLKLGWFEQAWDDYELRQQVRCSFVRRSLPWPQWSGDDLRDSTILVHGEQGLGDEIMFASCIGELASQAKRTVIECSPRLHRLFERSFPQATVVARVQSRAAPDWLADAPHIDCHVPAGSLPRHFRRTRSDFPQHSGYLVPDPDQVRSWRDRLSTLGAGLKVGVSWRGGLRSTRQSLRSLDLSWLAPILSMPGLHGVDLQYGDTAQERSALAAQGIVLASWPEAIEDLDATAALISSLDLVITVCTTVVHLAGALDRDAWVLVPAVPEWRYLAAGDTMPWYPRLRLFRQARDEGWDCVLARVALALRERVAHSAN